MLEVGVFIVPGSKDPEAPSSTIAAEGQDSTFAVQDHPYRAGFLDTWTLLSFCRRATERIGLFSDVLSLPLRQPSVVAKSATSLDLLSRGRSNSGSAPGMSGMEVEAMGGPRRTPGSR